MVSDASLPIPAAAMPTRDDLLDMARAHYGPAVSDLMDAVLTGILLPDDQAKVLLDVAQLTAFLMCIKAVKLRGQQPTRENLMAVWWPLQKALKDEVPGKLREFAADHEDWRAAGSPL